MVNIAIVEDEMSAAKMLRHILDTYAKEHGQTFAIKHYGNAELFLTDAKRTHDIVFLDIELSGMTGMDAAFKLREADKHAIIIFVTNMAQYAVKGYEVDALYYIIKPISYQSVAYKLQKALALLSANDGTQIVLQQPGGIVRLSTQNLMYVEIIGHKLLYHTDADTFTAYGSLTEAEKQLKDAGFFRCHNCYLVNAKYIAAVEGHAINLHDGTQIQISHPRKKQFMIDLMNWLGEGHM